MVAGLTSTAVQGRHIQPAGALVTNCKHIEHHLEFYLENLSRILVDLSILLFTFLTFGSS